MPSESNSSLESFQEYRGKLSSWLRTYMTSVRSLSKEEVNKYEFKGIVTGWQAETRDDNVSLNILLDTNFPYSPIQIAYAAEDRFLQWPHVERDGYLCLPAPDWLPFDNLANSAHERILQAIALAKKCEDDVFVREESAKEFVSYWAQASNSSVLSLVNLADRQARFLVTHKIEEHNCCIIADSSEGIQDWVDNQEMTSKPLSHQTLFGFINDPPALPLPKTSKELIEKLLKQCRGFSKLIAQVSIFKRTRVVLAIQTPDGVGMIGFNLSPLPKNGFRKRAKKSTPHKIHKLTLAAWRHYSSATLFRVSRTDSAWVHGRGLDSNHDRLKASRVLVIGAGSLGSQVASRLAQAGVGKISIVDPECLQPNNVGRHSLGIADILKNKASGLARVLRARYPHASFEAIPNEWQYIANNAPENFDNFDLIVSCIAEPNHDLAWDDFFRSSSIKAPCVYGWLGTQGATGHALALTTNSPGLSCFFDEHGFVRRPDTHFQGQIKVKFEPGCGTEFQPYGPLAVGHVELLVSRLCIDVLVKKKAVPMHLVQTCSTDDLNELGGQWTQEHLKHRPAEYHGPMQYEVEVTSCEDCHQCAKK